MKATPTSLAEAFVASANAHDAETFLELFAEDAIVVDVGREIRGLKAIRDWSTREIFQANVTFQVRASSEEGNVTRLVVEVDGDFDRTGLPNPLVMTQTLTVSGDKIVRLACQLGDELNGAR